jgi:hypothetical protein
MKIIFDAGIARQARKFKEKKWFQPPGGGDTMAFPQHA